MLCKVAWADPWVVTVTTQGSAHATLGSTRMTLTAAGLLVLLITWKKISVYKQFLTKCILKWTNFSALLSLHNKLFSWKTIYIRQKWQKEMSSKCEFSAILYSKFDETWVVSFSFSKEIANVIFQFGFENPNKLCLITEYLSIYLSN